MTTEKPIIARVIGAHLDTEKSAIFVYPPEAVQFLGQRAAGAFMVYPRQGMEVAVKYVDPDRLAKETNTAADDIMLSEARQMDRRFYRGGVSSLILVSGRVAVEQAIAEVRKIS